MVVLLPAPLGPMNPKQSPSWISRLRFDRATNVPYRLVRLTVLIITAIGGYLSNERSRPIVRQIHQDHEGLVTELDAAAGTVAGTVVGPIFSESVRLSSGSEIS